ncbi:hypothetical protein BU26DRAFT_190258 [Trematosphaeria pertusa]|uniref:Uncharacterized protein n=1 Tax=Trematosphaeria pertusa TaxID=390896 RepID=A0A6A6HS37_9PLEO|nr:uncharacterized protein BU26DRAFT_190258 [Trematosphaeria pertusa]KAF2240797.1 hypothetical protein BU26DRAFT_190258 [Trematosphaeria pertusa]
MYFLRFSTATLPQPQCYGSSRHVFGIYRSVFLFVAVLQPYVSLHRDFPGMSWHARLAMALSPHSRPATNPAEAAGSPDLRCLEVLVAITPSDHGYTNTPEPQSRPSWPSISAYGSTYESFATGFVRLTITHPVYAVRSAGPRHLFAPPKQCRTTWLPHVLHCVSKHREHRLTLYSHS